MSPDGPVKIENTPWVGFLLKVGIAALPLAVLTAAFL